MKDDKILNVILGICLIACLVSAFGIALLLI
jgi:hypothetical protein